MRKIPVPVPIPFPVTFPFPFPVLDSGFLLFHTPQVIRLVIFSFFFFCRCFNIQRASIYDTCFCLTGGPPPVV